MRLAIAGLRLHKPVGGDPLRIDAFWKLMQARIWLGILIGSTLGGLIPSLWDADMLSYSTLVLSGIGAFVGLWIAYKTR